MPDGHLLHLHKIVFDDHNTRDWCSFPERCRTAFSEAGFPWPVYEALNEGGLYVPEDEDPVAVELTTWGDLHRFIKSLEVKA
jgi:hypothetical protein